MNSVKEKKVWHVLLLATVFISLWPLVFMLSTSFKTLDQVFESALQLWPTAPTLSNYVDVLSKFPIGTYSINSLLIATIVTIGKLFTSVLAAFAFVYYDFKYKEYLFNFMLFSFFIPLTVLILPNYLFVSKLNLLNTSLGVALPGLVDGMGIFLFRQTMRSIPVSLFEVAKLEGMHSWQVLRTIVVPLIRPAFLSIGIVMFINSWNEYIWPLLVLQDKGSYTLPLALQMFMSAEGGNDWGLAMAVATLTSLPPILLYLLCQKYILRTFLQSGMKG